MPSDRIAAFFDYDNTLICGDSQFFEVRHYMRKMMLGPGFLLRMFGAYLLYKRHLYPAERIVRLCLTLYEGKTLRQVADEAELLYRQRISPALNRRVVDKLEEHKRQGHIVVIASASVPHLIFPAARELEITDFLCTQLATGPDGKLTGQTDGPVCLGDHKRALTVQYAKEHNIDLDKSYAYSDHHTDLSFLEVVGHPVAVRPTGPLKNIAIQCNWPILSD